MRYPVVVHHEDGSAYGVTVPDIPGCFSAGDTMDDALESVKEAIQGHLQLLAEDGEVAPVATSVEAHVSNEDYAGGVWALVEVDVTPYLGKSEKVTVTIPSIVLRGIEGAVQSGKAKNRSAFLTDASIKLLGGRI